MSYRIAAVDGLIALSLSGLCPMLYADPVRDIPTDLKFEPPARIESVHMASTGTYATVKAPYGWESAARINVRNGYSRY